MNPHLCLLKPSRSSIKKEEPGQTTTSVNLAMAFSQKGKKVLLIDLDPQAYSTIGLGFDVVLLLKRDSKAG
ncbi:AAA family ATPase [Candidatus Manganitrophus noduliformans]|uniref:AAA family ATPase n=1 Tax=Candidatus Manganitrophus noduliformans TaxID=2606439 RepID=UPI00192DE576|nr:AAA family ATPase [Candidatus Manganitrophus noduliformans]